MARYDVFAAGSSVVPGIRNCGQSNHIVYVSATDWYIFFISNDNSDVYYQKSDNSGLTWNAPVLIKATTGCGIAVWFDKWTPSDAGTLIHVAYMETAGSDVFYRSLDTASDTLGTEITVFAGASFSANANTCLSITKTREPKIIVAFDGDGGTETGTYESDDYPVTAFSALATDINEATTDYYWLASGNETGTDEFYAIFFDRSAGELTLKYGNGSAAYTEVALGTLTNIASSTVAPQVAICIGTNSHTYVAWWTNQDNAAADLNFIDITAGATVASLVKILDSADDQGGVALGTDTDNTDLYVFYLGKTDGSDTAFTSVSVNYRVSTDDGATWGNETLLSTFNRPLTYINCSLEGAGGIIPVAYGGTEAGVLNMVNSASVASSGGGNANILHGSVVA